MTSDARQLAAEIDELKRAVRDLQLAARLGNSSIEGRPVEVYDDDGTLRQVTGLQGDGTYTSVDLNAPAPPVPADPSVLGGGGLLTITSYGMTADGSDWPLDFSHIEVHVGTTSGFIPSPATLVGTFGFDGGVLSVALDEGTYYCVLVAANTSGVVSATSGEKSGTVVAPATSAGGITTYYAETEPVGLGPSDEGSLWYDTNDGNRLHRWDGTAWISVLFGGSALAADAIDGKTITGALIRTAALGERIEMDSTYAGRVRFFTGHPDEDPAFPGQVYVNSFDSVSGQNGSILLMDMSAPRHVGSTKAPPHIEVREQETAPGSGVFERYAIVAADKFQTQVDQVELGYTGSNTKVFLNGNEIHDKNHSRRYLATTSAITKSAWTRIPYDADEVTEGLIYTPGGFWTVTRPGVYLVVGSISWTRDNANRRAVRWLKNNVPVALNTLPASALDAFENTHSLSTAISCVPGDDLDFQCFHNSPTVPLIGAEAGPTLTWATITKVGA